MIHPVYDKPKVSDYATSAIDQPKKEDEKLISIEEKENEATEAPTPMKRSLLPFPQRLKKKNED